VKGSGAIRKKKEKKKGGKGFDRAVKKRQGGEILAPVSGGWAIRRTGE